MTFLFLLFPFYKKIEKSIVLHCCMLFSSNVFFKTLHSNFDICRNFEKIKMKFYILIIFKKSYWNFSLPCSLIISYCVRGSNNARHYAYVHGMHQGVNRRHKTHFKSATTGIHLQFALITQVMHGWSEALAMRFFLLKERCTTQRIKI